MKTDRYKDWESKFFEGEELTPEEELFLKNESDNPYFSFVKEEKKEKLDISFEDFLKKTEEPKIVALPIVKRKSYTQYWMAASLVLLMGISGFWMFNNPENIAPQIANHTVKPKKVETQKTNLVEENSKTKPVLANQESQNVIETKQDNAVKELVRQEFEKLMAQQNNPTNQQEKQIQVPTESTSDYNPNYVIINGKPIYNEQEAIAVTEDTFNYFASNVTQTINHAESAQNQSLDFYRILNF
jgi:hypothetical protein